jgi:hypothetical protein
MARRRDKEHGVDAHDDGRQATHEELDDLVGRDEHARSAQVLWSKMTDEQKDQYAAGLVCRRRSAQGLPATVDDDATLDAVVNIVDGAQTRNVN